MNKSIESKLFKLKKWLTLPETAKHLTVACREDVTEADILQLSLDGKLSLSVYFTREVFIKEVSSIVDVDSDLFCPTSVAIEEHDVFFNFGDKAFRTKELWDFAMVGHELTLIKDKWSNLIFNPDIDSQPFKPKALGRENIVGILLKDHDHMVQLQIEKFRLMPRSGGWTQEYCEARNEMINMPNTRPLHEYYCPALTLPDDSFLVIRTEALREFEQHLIGNNATETQVNKLHGNTENNAKKREEVLGAALAVITQWPDKCQNGSGKFIAAKIAALIDEKSLLFWPTEGKPPLSRDKSEREISKWINGNYQHPLN